MLSPATSSWEKHLPYILAGWVAFSVVLVLAQYLRIRRQPNPFPEIDSAQILFDEKGASGHSEKNVLTSIGGASGVLWLTVTRDEVWLRPRPVIIARMFAAHQLDLMHRIPRNRILSAAQESEAGRVVLQFTPPEGGMRRFVIRLKRPEEFLKAIHDSARA